VNELGSSSVINIFSKTLLDNLNMWHRWWTFWRRQAGPIMCLRTKTRRHFYRLILYWPLVNDKRETFLNEYVVVDLFLIFM